MIPNLENQDSIVKHDVLSPDGFPINHDLFYDNPLLALEAAKEWAKRYEKQGYYSSNKGRIPLDYILNECILLTYVDDKETDKFELYWLLPEDKQEPYF